MSVWDTATMLFDGLAPYSWGALGYWVGVLHVTMWQWLRDWQQKGLGT